MAIAGGATTAYRFKVKDNRQFEQTKMTYLSDMCQSVEDALATFASGQDVTVKGDDALKLRFQLIYSGYNPVPHG